MKIHISGFLPYVESRELDSFRRNWSFTGYDIPLIEFKRALTRKRKKPEYHKVGMDFVYKNKEYSIEDIVLNETWSPKKPNWKMKLFQFRRVYPPGVPVYCEW